MPRRPREVRKPTRDKGKLPKPDIQEAAVATSHVREVLRFRCPCCGLMATAEHLGNAPYEPALFLQRFGGRLPHSKTGYMEYVPLTEAAELATFLELELLPVLKQICQRYNLP